MLNILILDDSHVVVNYITHYLHGKGYNVYSFINGYDAMTMLKNNIKIDIALIDINLNEISGTEVAEFIHKKNPKTKIIAITGMQNFKLIKPFNTILLKPFEVKILDKIINQLVNNKK